MRNQIRLAEVYVPLGLWGAAALSLVVGALVHRRRPRIDLLEQAPAGRPERERQPVDSGAPR
jgi:hypothetical protein